MVDDDGDRRDDAAPEPEDGAGFTSGPPYGPSRPEAGEDGRGEGASAPAFSWLPILDTTPGEGNLFLRWLLLARVAIITSILAAALYIQWIAAAELSLQPLFTLLGITYALSLSHALLVRAGYTARWLTALQLSLGIVLDTFLIYYVGGVQSPLVVVYLVTVAAAGLLLTRRGALGIASLAGICYGAMADLIYLGLIPPWPFEVGTTTRPFTAIELYYRVFAVLLGCYLIAWGTSALSSRLQETRQELRAERSQVQALEELNEQIIEGMSSGLIATDADGRIVTFNSAALEIMQRSPESLMERPVWEVFGDDPEMFHSLEERLHRRHIYRTERPLVTPGGERRIIGMSVTQLGWRERLEGESYEAPEDADPPDPADVSAAAGTVGGSGASAADGGVGTGEAVSDGGETVEATRASEAQHGAVGSSAVNGPVGGGEVGRSADAEEVEAPDEPDEASAGGSEGSDAPDAAEAPRGYIFMFQDLSEIKRMEQELRIRDRMAVLGEMAGSIAHEIRNPLASISGSLQMLRKGQIPLDTPSSRELMDIVIRESERLSTTIEQFLEFARPREFQAEEVDLLELARDTIALLRNSTELKPEHKLRIDAPPGDYVVVADGSQIKQVFWNLARNGIEAMPDGGTLQISLERRPHTIEVVFEDEGVGMRPEEIERFFQPYVSGSTHGAGLGLAVVYRVLERHGIKVEVDSEPDEGTRFALTFEGREGADLAEQLVLIGSSEREGGGPRLAGPPDAATEEPEPMDRREPEPDDEDDPEMSRR